MTHAQTYLTRARTLLDAAERQLPAIAQTVLMKDMVITREETFGPFDPDNTKGDYTASLQTLAALRGPVDAFFDGVMVNAEEMDLRLNRQGLLKTLHEAMNRVADLSRLAS